MTQCSFCNREIPEAIVIMDLNNNAYCKSCAEEKFKSQHKAFTRMLKEQGETK